MIEYEAADLNGARSYYTGIDRGLAIKAAKRYANGQNRTQVLMIVAGDATMRRVWLSKPK